MENGWECPVCGKVWASWYPGPCKHEGKGADKEAAPYRDRDPRWPWPGQQWPYGPYYGNGTGDPIPPNPIITCGTATIHPGEPVPPWSYNTCTTHD